MIEDIIQMCFLLEFIDRLISFLAGRGQTNRPYDNKSSKIIALDHKLVL